MLTFALSSHGAETMTAWATLTLAILTASLAGVTAWLVHRTREGMRQQQTAAEADLDANREATRSAQATAQRQIEATYRPLLIDVLRYGPIYTSMGARREPPGPTANREASLDLVRVSHGGQAHDIDPRRVWAHRLGEEMLVSVPLRNVGQGLAIIDPKQIELSGAHVGATKRRFARPERVPARETTRVSLIFWIDQATETLLMLEGARNWKMVVPYTDFIGGQKTTAVISLRSEGGADLDRPDTWWIDDVQQRIDETQVQVRLPEPSPVPPAHDEPSPTGGTGMRNRTEISGIQRWREKRRASRRN
jgi:hypothetical protein